MSELLESFEDMKAVFDRLTYKPNFEMKLVDLSGESAWPDSLASLHMSMYVPDSTKPQPPVRATGIEQVAYLEKGPIPFQPFMRYQQQCDLTAVSGIRHVPPDITGDRFIMWVGRCLRELEMHELDEWFKVDGKPLNDPHAVKQ
jgi:hypothetical protein